MGLEWAADFSYGYYRKILEAARSSFECHPVCEAPQALRGGPPQLLLRHDIDVSLVKALRMAEIEAEYGLRATYMVIPNAALYSLTDAASRRILRQLIDMGHEVALHFDVDPEERSHMCDLSTIEARMVEGCRQVEDATGVPVRSVSFHRPLPQFLHGPLVVCDRVNAYAGELMGWYLSDSKGRWREGEPLPRLRNPDRPLLQLLVHPIWWGDEHQAPEDRLEAFFWEEAHGRSPAAVQAFDAALAATVPAVLRRGVSVSREEESVS